MHKFFHQDNLIHFSQIDASLFDIFSYLVVVVVVIVLKCWLLLVEDPIIFAITKLNDLKDSSELQTMQDILSSKLNVMIMNDFVILNALQFELSSTA